MKIGTKYNVGDKVWIISNSKPMEFTIMDIEIYIHKDIPPGIWYINQNDEGYEEELVYPSKEELLKSL